MAIKIPRWLRPLVGLDPRPEWGGPRKPDPLARITDEEIDAAVAKLLDSLMRASRPIDVARTRQFIESLPSLDRPLPAWQWAYILTPSEVLERALPRSYRRGRR